MATLAPATGLPQVAAWDLPFDPLFRDPHLETIIGRYWPVTLDEAAWPTEAVRFATEAGVEVLAHRNRCSPRASGPLSQLDSRPRPTVLAVHGLTASSQASYMRILAQRALEAGFDVIRLNVRNCGGTEHLAPTLYHSGLTVDLREVVRQLAPTPLFLAGFSMGGNMVLKLAGEWGEQPPAHVVAVCGISVPIALAACARRLGESVNRLYEARFLSELRQTLLRKQQLMPELFSELCWDGIGSIYEFDDAITAPSFGFRNADHYYESASSAGFLDSIRVPSLVIQAQDDPFIPFEVFRATDFERNSYLHLRVPEHGGHVSFLAKRPPRFWAIEQTLRFFKAFGG